MPVHFPLYCFIPFLALLLLHLLLSNLFPWRAPRSALLEAEKARLRARRLRRRKPAIGGPPMYRCGPSLPYRRRDKSRQSPAASASRIRKKKCLDPEVMSASSLRTMCRGGSLSPYILSSVHYCTCTGSSCTTFLRTPCNTSLVSSSCANTFLAFALTGGSAGSASSS